MTAETNQFKVGDEEDGSSGQLAILGTDLAKKRSEAITARKDSGIERVWYECENAYMAIDEESSSQAGNGKWVKPTSINGPVTVASEKSKNSLAYVRLTSRYVDMGAAKICDVLLPIDDKAFSIKAIPDDDLVKMKGNKTPFNHPTTGVPMTRDATPGEAAAITQAQPPAPPAPVPMPGQPAPAPAAPATPVQVPMTVADIAQFAMDQAQDSAEQAETRIANWLTESGFPSEMRKVVHDCSRLGVGVVKAPTPIMQQSMALKNGRLIINLKAVPAVQWKDPWNIYPYGACGENINDGDGVFEKDSMSSAQLKKLKLDKTYLPGMIDHVLKEGPGKVLIESQNPAEVKNKDQFEVWYFTGTVQRSDMMLTNAIGIDDLPDEVNDIHAICTMVNDTVIRAIINPLESGSFGYHSIPWSRRAGHWGGIGVAEQVAMPQRMVNAGTRALLNNAGLSAGVQIVLDPLAIVPANQDNTITPNKIWYMSADCRFDDVRKAFQLIEFPNIGDEIMKIVEYAVKLAEEATNIPLISQGQTGPTTPETFGATELQNNNANTLLRNLALAFDDHITDPVVTGFYEWLLLDPKVPDVEKGSFKIEAKGSLAMVEKAIQEQTMALLGPMIAQNPAFRGDPKRWFAEYLKIKRIDPRKVMYSEAEQEKMDAQPPTPPVQVQVATLKGQNDLTLQNAKTQGELQLSEQEMEQEQKRLANGNASPHMAAASAKIEEARIRATSAQQIESSRANTELQYAETEAQMARDNANARLQELELNERIAILQYSTQQKISLTDTNAQLAKAAIDARTKRELAAAQVELHASEGEKNRQHAATLQNNEISSQQLAEATPNG